MKTRVKTIKGWANNTSYLTSSNVRNDTFATNLQTYVKTALQGFTELKFWDTLRGKNATEVVIIKGWYWRGVWNDPTKKIITKYYR